MPKPYLIAILYGILIYFAEAVNAGFSPINLRARLLMRVSSYIPKFEAQLEWRVQREPMVVIEANDSLSGLV